MDGTARVSVEWVLLCYRVPREPSTPRIAVWRKLKRLGVAQLGDGLVALPADARTREALEWVANDVVEAGGTAMVWLGRPTGQTQERQLAEAMASARGAEYTEVTEQAIASRELPETDRSRVWRRLRADLRAIARRDFFPPPERETARRAVHELTGSLGAAVAATSGELL